MEIGRSRERVTAVLNGLKGAYDSFPVRQMSVSVKSDPYERAVRYCKRGVVDITVRVRNDDNAVLVFNEDGVEQEPSGPIAAEDKSIEDGARRLVRELTGVSCRIVDLASVDIVDIHDSTNADREPVYRLSAVFEAVYTGGELRECAKWGATVPRLLTA